MGATERVVQFIDFKGISKYKFCKDLGFSNKFLDNSSNMGTDKAGIILHHYPEINPEWLLTGKGEMLKTDIKSSTSINVIEINPESKLNTLIADIKASAGFGNIINNHIELEKLPAIALPDTPFGLNIAFQINGDSMHPTIRHFDYVAGNRLLDMTDIREGNVYIIVDKEDGVLCKRLYKHHNGFNIVSDNPIYKPYHRSYEDILAIFKAFARLSYDFRNYHDDIRTIVQDHEDRIVLLEYGLKSKKLI